MMKVDPNSYKIPLIFAISLHGLLLMLLISKYTGQNQLQITSFEQVDIVKAVSLDQDQVEIEIAKIQAEKQQQQQAELTKQKQLQEQVTIARKQREQEEQRLKKLKAQTQTNEQNQLKAQQSAQEKLNILQSQQQAEQQQLKNLQRQQQQEQQALTQLEGQRREFAKQLQAERAALEKRRLQEQQQRQRIIETQVDHYKNLIVHAISRNWIIPPNLEDDLSCQFEIQLAHDGAVEAVRLIRSSGDPILDRSAETAIYRSSPLPVPSDPDAFASFQVLNLTVRPEAMVS